ncbi:carbamoyltransferase HypF [Lyngbya confervoides]|uniref:Carbamoyltransferase n=1 Tax=Lyngbya confervoides BDU141951 TaxID=1574623 RepID=A0ABD4T189_9CYAN|nr:carbamoyltransferase HypF [Lyngbya confervoides]MCM1982135.1 carbamoyltransferase HypF [Lyngbya confervoides BDU141951]
MIAAQSPRLQRLHLIVQGQVQGVGFRPFVYRLAQELGLGGWICNSDRGVEIDVEGPRAALAHFLQRLEGEHPPQATLTQVQRQTLAPQGYHHFEIHPSQQFSPRPSAELLPDLATCPACLQELFDPRNRRYRYPFINCTQCGPRYSILQDLPYDRPRTTMQGFAMCAACQREYDNPSDRRFHAQPNACPDCGPQLAVWTPQGQTLDVSDPIQWVGDRLRQGEIVALKGLGGFHLLADARSEAAVQRLRDRKHRPTKPLAVMYPHLDRVQRDFQVSTAEGELLVSAIAPIVLLTPRTPCPLAAAVAPGQHQVGVILPYSPLHHLLLSELDFPVIATSGNRSGDPICIENQEALAQLGAIADVFLVHNRPIARAVDDSVVQVIENRPTLRRRSRGYAPGLTLRSDDARPCILAVGGHLKNTVALSLPGQIILSQHLGGLGQVSTAERFQNTIADLLRLYQAQPVAIACDAHPDYFSSQYAQTLSQQMAVPLIPLQHHQAHILSAMIEHGLNPPVLGIAWDGSGYGLDGTIWGGECFQIHSEGNIQRVAHLRPFPLPGGDRAAREPRRAALGLLHAAGLDAALIETAFSPPDLPLLTQLLNKGVNAPLTSSIGRLFDAIASLVQLCQISSFEGEAAMALEAVALATQDRYPYTWRPGDSGVFQLDWEPMLRAILSEGPSSPGLIAAKFQNTLLDAIGTMVQQVGISQVVLTGGCFQNRYLLTGAIAQIRNAGFDPYWPQQIPANDGGLALGQILGATWQLQSTGGVPCA